MPLPLSWIVEQRSRRRLTATRHGAARRAAVLDDVADRLAQDARRLHVGARRQRSAAAPRTGSSIRPRCRPAPSRDTTSARQSPSASVSRTGLPVSPRTDSRISSSASRASVEMRSLSLVCTIVSSLAPRSSCRSAAMRLRSRCGHLLDAHFGELREVALDLGGGLAHPRFERVATRFGGAAAPSRTTCTSRRPTAMKVTGTTKCSTWMPRHGQLVVLHRELDDDDQRHQRHQHHHQPELLAVRAPREPQVDPRRDQHLDAEQHVPGVGQHEDAVGARQREARRHHRALHEQRHVDRALHESRVAQQELHRAQPPPAARSRTPAIR